MFGAFEVKLVGTKFEIVDVIWGTPPKSGTFDLASLHRIMMIYSNDETLKRFYGAPRLDTPVKWMHLPGEGLNDWLGIIHQASLDVGELKKLRSVKDELAGLHFIIVIYHYSDGRWAFPSQAICDLLLVENDRVFAPIYLKDRKPVQIWAHHPLESKVHAFKKLIAETARAASK